MLHPAFVVMYFYSYILSWATEAWLQGYSGMRTCGGPRALD